MRIAVIGAGPGGLAAAATAAENGADVLLVDDFGDVLCGNRQHAAMVLARINKPNVPAK